MQKDPGATQGQPGGDELKGEGAQPAETATQETPGNTEDAGGEPGAEA